MANVNQIYLMVNDSAAEALGEKAITVKDTGTLVSLGNQVFSSQDDTEQFYKALTDRIGRTVVAIRSFEMSERSVKRDEMEWGIIYQKISYKTHQAVENPSWDVTPQADPFDIDVQTEAVQKLFSRIGTWSYEDSIPDYQLQSAFTSPAAMGAFISGIYINMENAMKIAEEQMANLAVNTYMAGAFLKGTTAQTRNLLAEYNAIADEPTTAAKALTNVEFLRFASREINTVCQNMRKPSAIYNAEGIARQTTRDNLVVEVLGQFASATASYLQSDTYHKELVALPRYEEVVYWQGSGTGFAFEDVSSINIANKDLAVTGNTTGAVSKSGIVAFAHDRDAVASIIYRRRSHSIYNPRAERYNIFEKADKGYAVDLSENGVVFYIADVPAPTRAAKKAS